MNSFKPEIGAKNLFTSIYITVMSRADATPTLAAGIAFESANQFMFAMVIAGQGEAPEYWEKEITELRVMYREFSEGFAIDEKDGALAIIKFINDFVNEQVPFF